LLMLGVLVLGLQDAMPLGIPIGGVRWRPQFAPVILGSVGSQLIWFAIIAHAYYSNAAPNGTPRSDAGLLSAFSRYFSLEFALLISALMIILGIALEMLLGLQQLDLIAPHEALASFGAFSMIVGLESFFSAFVTHLLSLEQTQEHTRLASPPNTAVTAVPTTRRPQIPVTETAATTVSNSA